MVTCKAVTYIRTTHILASRRNQPKLKLHLVPHDGNGACHRWRQREWRNRLACIIGACSSLLLDGGGGGSGSAYDPAAPVATVDGIDRAKLLSVVAGCVSLTQGKSATTPSTHREVNTLISRSPTAPWCPSPPSSPSTGAAPFSARRWRRPPPEIMDRLGSMARGVGSSQRQSHADRHRERDEAVDVGQARGQPNE
jgi:hypothetical protein